MDIEGFRRRVVFGLEVCGDFRRREVLFCWGTKGVLVFEREDFKIGSLRRTKRCGVIVDGSGLFKLDEISWKYYRKLVEQNFKRVW